MGINRLGQVWPEWKVEKKLGEGSFGQVYKAVRVDSGVTVNSAIKVITIPKNDAELNAMRTEGMSEKATRAYFQGILEDFVNEIKLMESLKGTQNIVSVEDFKVLEKSDEFGWDIFIRMELLTNFSEFMNNEKLPETEVIKLGIDILNALELCSHLKIVHRDIKPENIFISSFGYFKLGDFGIARELGKTSGNLSSKGTFNYMAPEVASGGHYDATVDIYSLGIVLFKLLNNNRIPFLNPYKPELKFEDFTSAIERRKNGEPLTAPIEASNAMTQVVLKACAYDPRYRYQSPIEFRQALEAINTPGVAAVKRRETSSPPFSEILLTPEEATDRKMNETVRVRQAPAAKSSTNKLSAKPVAGSAKEKRKPSPLFTLAAAMLILSIIGVGAFFVLINNVNARSEPEPDTTLESETRALVDVLTSLDDYHSLPELDDLTEIKDEIILDDLDDEVDKDIVLEDADIPIVDAIPVDSEPIDMITLDQEAREAFMEFLNQRAFESYGTELFEWNNTQYAITDINSDGVSELIVRADAEPDNSERYHDIIFEFDTTHKNVVHVSSFSHRGHLRFSHEHNALSFSDLIEIPVDGTYEIRGCVFFLMLDDFRNDGVLFMILLSQGERYISFGRLDVGDLTELSQEEFQYLIDEPVDIEFINIP